MTCSKCRFYEPNQSQCRINPPTRVSDGYGIQHGWPLVKPFQACGHFASGKSVVTDEPETRTALSIQIADGRTRPKGWQDYV